MPYVLVDELSGSNQLEKQKGHELLPRLVPASISLLITTPVGTYSHESPRSHIFGVLQARLPSCRDSVCGLARGYHSRLHPAHPINIIRRTVIDSVCNENMKRGLSYIEKSGPNEAVPVLDLQPITHIHRGRGIPGASPDLSRSTEISSPVHEPPTIPSRIYNR
jgi:hypothetical protein